jgi:hypothetical protein
MSKRTLLRVFAVCVVLVGLIGTYDLFVDPARRVADPFFPFFMFFGPPILALGAVLLYIGWGSAGASQVQANTGKIVVSGLGGFLGTFAVMLVLAGLLDRIFPAGPGPGAMVFYLSFILSPVVAVVGGLWGVRIGKRRAESEVISENKGEIRKSLPVGFREVGAVLAIYATVTAGFFTVISYPYPFYAPHNQGLTPSEDVLKWFYIEFILTSVVLVVAGCLLCTRHVRAAWLLLFTGLLGLVLEGVLAYDATATVGKHGSTGALIILITGPMLIMAAVWTVVLLIVLIKLSRYLKNV